MKKIIIWILGISILIIIYLNSLKYEDYYPAFALDKNSNTLRIYNSSHFLNIYKIESLLKTDTLYLKVFNKLPIFVNSNKLNEDNSISFELNKNTNVIECNNVFYTRNWIEENGVKSGIEALNYLKNLN